VARLACNTQLARFSIACYYVTEVRPLCVLYPSCLDFQRDSIIVTSTSDLDEIWHDCSVLQVNYGPIDGVGFSL